MGTISYCGSGGMSIWLYLPDSKSSMIYHVSDVCACLTMSSQKEKKINEGAYNILFLYGNNMTLFYSIKIRNLQHHHSKMNLSNL